MKRVALSELMPARIPSVNPAAHPDEPFTLWSIPSYDVGEPEQVYGREVGSTKKSVLDGDVLLSKIVPHIRRAWKVSVADSKRQIASSEWITFRHSDFLPDYIRHFFLTDQFHRQFMGTLAGVGGSLLRAQPKSVAKISIPFLPLDEQRRIVGVLGRCAMWRAEVDLCLHQNHLFRVRMGNRVVPDYARAFMQSDAARGYFLRVAKRTTGIASINKTQLGLLPVWVPPIPLQTAFAEQAQRLEATARALDAAAAKADAMAAALSAEVFG